MADKGTTIATGYIQIKPTTKDIKSNLKKAFSDVDYNAEGESMGSKLGSAIKKGLAVIGIGKVLKDSIEEGANLEQSIGGVETLFKTAGDTVKQYAAEAFKTAGVSANDYMQMATSSAAALVESLGGDTAKAAELTNMAIIDMSDNANKMGTDLASIQNAYAGFAKGNFTLLDNLKLGYGGTRSEMERLLAKAGEINGVKYDINNLSDIYEAIHTIQGELDITGTTADEAATTISGSMAMMKAAFQNVMGNLAIGADIKEPLRQLIETAIVFLRDNLIPAIVNIISAIPEVLQVVFTEGVPAFLTMGQEIITNILTGLTESLPGLFEAGAETINQLAAGFGEGIPAFLEQILPLILSFTETLRENFGTFVDAGIEMILSLVDGLIAGLPDLIAYVPEIVSNICGLINDNAPKFLEAGVEILAKLIQGVIDTIPVLIENFGSIVQMVLDIWQAINWLALGQEVLTFIADGVKSLFSSVPDLLKEIGDTAWDWFKNIDWGSLGTSLIDFIAGGISDIGGSIGETLLGFADDAFQGFINFDWAGVGQAVIDGIVQGLEWFGESIANTLLGFASDAWNSVCDFFGIHSPSTLFAGLGRYIDLGWSKGLDANAGVIKKSMDNLEEIATPEVPEYITNTAPAPVNLGSGGVVNNNSSRTYGDINVTLTGTGDSNENRMIRKVRDAIQREIDRGEVFA